MHHVCLAGRPSTLGQHSGFKPNLATIEFLKCLLFAGFVRYAAKGFQNCFWIEAVLLIADYYFFK